MSSTKFCFIVTAFDCESRIAQTIMSVAAQSYKNWRMIVRCDQCTDATADEARELAEKLDMTGTIKVVETIEKCGEVRNTIEAAEEIDDHEVICRLDGGDWLTDTDTLAFLDNVYQTHDPAAVWTAHRWSYTAQNISGPLPEHGCNVYDALRGERWCTSHLKTWRKSAMNGINPANWRDENGDWIMIACDRAVYLPILHKALLDGKKRMFIPLCCYHYEIKIDDPELFTNERSRAQRQSADKIHDRGYIE